MKIIPAIIIIAAFIALLSCSGCVNQQTTQAPVTQVATTQATPAPFVTPSQPSQPSPAVTTIQATAQQTATDTLPEEVAILPSEYAVDIGIEKDRVYNTITITFNGGRGQVLVKNILVRVTTSDGRTEQKYLPVGNQVAIGSSIDMKGSHGPDRVEVFVTLGGITYKVKDENMTFAYY
jgi:glucose/arabinose dehydrogenase